MTEGSRKTSEEASTTKQVRGRVVTVERRERLDSEYVLFESRADRQNLLMD